ncbi:MAG: ornithine cyclodeaminase family protein [Chloroflexi bacterium]|nr:ornithine cyclodeaminase family protein [Chloroflexota bacterium]
MVLCLTEDDIKQLLTMDDCIEILDKLFKDEANGRAENKPTIEFNPPGGGMFRIKAGIIDSWDSIGLKAYTIAGGRRLVFVFNLKTGFDGIVDSVHLTQIRTGAVSGLATRYMAREDARTVGIIGTGKEARTQLEAVSRVRALTHVKAYSRSAENRERYAIEMSKKLDLEVEPVDSAQTCVKGADIVITATGSSTPVLMGEWLEEGMHINAIGATTMFKRELDENAIGRCDRIVVEHLPQAEAELGQLLYAASRGKMRWTTVHEMKDIVSGAIPGRTSPKQITLVSTIGVGTEDVAVAAEMMKKARALGIGSELPL